MLKINNEVIYVKGALNGAIYDFSTGNVYSINKDACDIIDKLINKEVLTEKDKEFVKQLIESELYDVDFVVEPLSIEKSDTPALKTVWLEITQACNLKCVHCYEGHIHTSVKNKLNLDEWKKIIDQLSEEKVKSVIVIGGEPCCNTDLIDILEYLAKKDFKTITLFSNGTLFDNRLFDVVIKNNILCKFSLYGHNAEVHDCITTQKGSFDKLLKTIKILKEKNVQVDISVIAMKENEDYQEEIKELVENLGIEYKGFDVIRNVYGGTQNKHVPTNQSVLDRCKFSEPSFFAIKERFIDNCYKNSCWYGKIAITETGDVLPCVFERNLTYGNLRDSSLREVMNGEKLLKYWYKTFEDIEFCKDCEYRYACKDCRPLGLSCTGDINGKNPRCLYNPYTGEWGNSDAK